MEQPTRVLIVDDHVVLREGLAGLLDEQADMRVVSGVGTSAAAVSAATELTPDVVVLDHRLPDADGVRTTAAVRAAAPGARIVMFTATDDRRLMASAAAAGCVGFVVKTAPCDEIISAVRAAAAGAPWEWPSSEADVTASALTDRELAALELAAAGLDNNAIAGRLYLSVNTVRNHFQRILIKLGAHSKLEAVAVAANLGLVSQRSSEF